MAQFRKLAPSTIAAKTYLDGQRQDRPLSVPIHQSVNFEAPTSEVHGERFRERSAEFYLRFGHPTLRAAAQKVAELEGAEAGLVFSSGMAAITTTLLALCGGSGRHILAQREIFGQTYTFLATTLRSLGIEVTFVAAEELAGAHGSVRSNTSLIYAESPSNPLLKIVDIAGVARIARAKDIPLIVDSTFASPVLQNPIELGATAVVHSATKSLSGHNDVICGACVGPSALISQIARLQELLGSVLDPHAAWLLLRGIKTIHLRVAKQSQSALEIAQFLGRNNRVRKVIYPYLRSTPRSEIAMQQMRGGGGVLCFELVGGVVAARAFVNRLRLIPIASSLGGVETIVELPAELDWNEKEVGPAPDGTAIPPGLIRMSLGVEDSQDILNDVQRALKDLIPRPSRGTTAQGPNGITGAAKTRPNKI